MELQELVENIKFYQESGVGHPLTCGNDSKHALLVPYISEGAVVLQCPTCGRNQDNIPKIPSKQDIIKMKKVLEGMMEDSLREPEPEPESKTILVRIQIDAYVKVTPYDGDTMEEAIAYKLETLNDYREDLHCLIENNLHNAKVTRIDKD